jgi:cytochrome c biogenesis protein CcdA
MFGVSGLKIERLRQASASVIQVTASYGAWSAIWVAAHGAGGTVIGAMLGTVGTIFRLKVQMSYWIVTAILVLGGLHHFGVLRVSMPQVHRQVPRHWMLRWPLAWVALGYGIQLGSAVATRITNFATYAALAAAISTGSPFWGAVTMMVFGVARALPAVLVGPFAGSPDRSFILAFRVGEWEEPMHRISAAILLLVVLILPITKWSPI